MKPELAFRALSEKPRLRLLGLLGRGEVCVCDLMAALELPQPTVSRHLAYLKTAGLVTDRREGRWRYYSRVRRPGRLHAGIWACVEACAAADPAIRSARRTVPKENRCR
jgi:ArsR family transcriptional regulator